MEIELELCFDTFIVQIVDFKDMICLLMVCLSYKSENISCVQETEFCMCYSARFVFLKKKRINDFTLDYPLPRNHFALFSKIWEIPNQNSFPPN